jgi:sugar phosphate isomerase/epimerase
MTNRKFKERSRYVVVYMAVAATAGALSGCAAGLHPANSTSPSWRSGMAIQLYSFHRDLERDLPGTLWRIKALGFDRVETYPVANVSARELRVALDAAGLDAISAHMPWDRIKSDVAGVIADARVLGVDQFGPGSINLFDGKPFRLMTLGEADEAGAHLKRACAAARSANMRIFIHTHGNEFTRAGDSTPLDRMLKSAGNCFDTQADISWVKWAGANPAAFIRRYGAKVTSLHVKDIAATAVGREFGSFGPESFTIVGQGAVDWADVMRAARASNVRYYIVEDESADPAQQIPHSLKHLDEIRF